MLIAGAGGAAHLPGMAAAKTALPVLGVPVESKTLKGMDSLLSIVQMPAGVPVGTLAIGRAGAVNAALLAAAIVARSDEGVRERLARVPGRADRGRARRARPAAERRQTVTWLTSACIGGGQLGRMLALAGIPLGLSFRFLDPVAGCARPARSASSSSAPTTIRTLLDRLADGADVVTYEFENVPVEAARARRRRCRRRRRSRPRRTGWSRSSCSAGSASRRPRIDDEVGGVPRDPEDAAARLRRQGPAAGARHVRGLAPDTSSRNVSRFDRELSLLAVRGADGETRVLPARRERARGRHPAQLARARAGRAAGARPRSYAARLLDELGYVGVLALELFDVGGRLLANELAPRVHNTRPLDDRGRGDEPVREPPARGPRPAARLDRRCAARSRC